MLAGQDRRGVADAQEVAAVVDARNGVELRDGLGRHAARPENAGVRHEHVEPAVAAHDLVEAGGDRFVVCDVERDADGPPGAELGSQGLRLALCQIGVDVGQHDVAALGHEVGRDRMPKALGGAGHHDNEPSGTPGDRPAGGNPSAIRLGLPALDEAPLRIGERADAAHAVRVRRRRRSSR